MLAAMGVPLKAIMQRVGHNKPDTTLGIYTHVSESMQKELCEKLDRISVKKMRIAWVRISRKCAKVRRRGHKKRTTGNSSNSFEAR